MLGVDASLTTRVVVRKLALTFVGVLLLAGGLTLVFESMRSVMDVGGTCATGGPFEVRQECPDGAWLIVVGIFAGLLGTGLVVAGTFAGGPRLFLLAWPALFLSLGWNFLEYGVDPPPPEDGLVWGWLVCAVAFFAMGGIPLLLVLWKPRITFWGSDPGGRDGSAPAVTRLGTVRVRDLRPDRRSSPWSPTEPATSTAWRASTASTTTPSSAAPEPGGASDVDSDVDSDLVTDLERLARLHRDGHLTADEFARAKAARFAEEGS